VVLMTRIRIVGAASIWCLLAVVGCEEGPPVGPPGGVELAVASRVPRLSHAEWENTVQDLFELPQPTGLSVAFEPDPLGGKEFDDNESALSVGPVLWANYQAAAETVAGTVVTDPALLANIVPTDLPTEPNAKARGWIGAFGKRAFRRPLANGEIDAYAALFAQGTTHYPEMGDAFVSGVRLSLEAFLQSPHFLYRPELGDAPEGVDRFALTGWEVASRLSYALWNTMPDEELFRAAEEGELDGEEGLVAQAERLLEHPRAKAAFLRLHDQLYDAEQYLGLAKSAVLYPTFDPVVGEEMREELSRFVSRTLVEEDGGLKELLTSRTTFVTPRLAEIYGIDPQTLSFDADGYAEVELGDDRSGLLTRAGFLAWKGTQTQPDTILRGVFVNRKIICQLLGDPPNEAAGAMLGDENTNREKVNALTGPGTCGASCHGKFINPIGYAFEHYGAMGEWRDMDNGFPIDSSSSFKFDGVEKTYGDAVELSNIMAESPSVHACYAGFLAEFVLAREIQAGDAPFLEDVSALSLTGASARSLIVELVKSDAFRMRSTKVEVAQ